MPIYLGSRETSLAFNDWVSHSCSTVLLQGDGLSRAKGVYWKTLITKYVPLYKLCISLPFLPLYPKGCCLDSHTFLSYCTYKEKVTLTLFSCKIWLIHPQVSEMVCSGITQSQGICPKLCLHSSRSAPSNKIFHPTELWLPVYSCRNQLSIQILSQDISRAVNIKCNNLTQSSAEVGYHNL